MDNKNKDEIIKTPTKEKVKISKIRKVIALILFAVALAFVIAGIVTASSEIEVLSWWLFGIGVFFMIAAAGILGIHVIV